MKQAVCRFCSEPLVHTFCDLGMSPLSNSYLTADKLNKMEPFYPLHAYVCSQCHLVQLQEFENPEHIFSDYAYFSSYSDSWLQHAKSYVLSMTERFGYDANSLVIEIASNDGYLLKNFVEKNIPVLGIEPAGNVARVAQQAGVETISEFFGVKLAEQLSEDLKKADLLIGNNVLAHVPDLNDFVAGMKILLKTDGVITMEFPHLLQLMEQNQFDTIYHEHFSYFSFLTAEKVFAAHGLKIFDLERLTSHGGSLRIFARHAESLEKDVSESVSDLRALEIGRGLDRMETYAAFSEQVREVKRKLLGFLIEQKYKGKKIAGYGAPAKGNTLLNYCGIRGDFIDYTVDMSPHKQGRFLPGTHIPICHPDRIRETRPDFVLILPWNLKNEIMEQMAYISDWGGQFVIPIPEVMTIK